MTSTTSQPTSTTLRAESLRGLCDGAVHLPGDAGYDAARLPWNVALDQRPAAVARPTTVAQVQQVVRAAAAADLRIAPQSTGHNAGPLVAQGLDDVVVLRTSAMTGVTIDPVRRIARVEGGALWLHATEAAGDHGLAALHGSSPDVGIAGYSLGGGIGWYARRLGLATNSLTAVELVTADGEHLRADAHRNAELFWALRRGWRQLRGRDGARVPAVRDQVGLRGHAHLGPRAGRAGAASLGTVGSRRPRRRHHLLPDPQPAADP